MAIIWDYYGKYEALENLCNDLKIVKMKWE